MLLTTHPTNSRVPARDHSIDRVPEGQAVAAVDGSARSALEIFQGYPTGDDELEDGGLHWPTLGPGIDRFRGLHTLEGVRGRDLP